MALEIVFFSRNFRNFTVRFRQDTELCGGRRLAELINEWKPDRPEITLKWVTPPEWPLRIRGLPKIKSRMAGGQLEWEFSDETKRDWSTILAGFLSSIDRCNENVKQAREVKTENLHKETVRWNLWCRFLYYFVIWEAGIVEDLLMKTNMVDGIPVKFLVRRTGNSRCLVNALSQSLLFGR